MTVPFVLVTALGIVVSARSVLMMSRGTGGVRDSVFLPAFCLLVLLADTKTTDHLFGGAVKQGAQVLAIACVLVATFAAWRSPSRQQVARTPAALKLLLLLCGWLFLADLMFATVAPVSTLLGRLLSFVAVSCLVILGRLGAITWERAGRAVMFSFGVSAAMTLVTPDPTRPCSAFKCGPLGFQLTGPFFNENTFGMVAVMALVFALACRDRFLQVSVIATVGAVLFLSESRNSQISAAVIVALTVMWRVLPTSLRRWTTLPLSLAPTLLTAVGLIMVYQSERGDFSNRGNIWRLGTQQLGDDWIFGAGLDTWSTEVLERNFMHSHYLLLLYSGGAVAIIIGAAMMTYLMTPTRFGRFDSALYTLPLAVLVGGLVQVPWNPLAIEQNAIVGVALVACAFAQQHDPATPPNRRAKSRRASRGTTTSRPEETWR